MPKKFSPLGAAAVLRLLFAMGMMCSAALPALAANCTPANTLRADVAALDMPMVFNRLGAQNVNWQMYALWRDLVGTSKPNKPLVSIDEHLKTAAAASTVPFSSFRGKVTVRPDLRPRPLALRVAAGQCLHVRFVNLLTTVSNPRNATQTTPFAGHPMNQRSHLASANIDDQVASRVAGFHPQGLELVRSIADDSSHVGNNPPSLAAPGQMREYWFYAPHEGAFLVSNPGAVFGGEGTAGTAGTGLFGAVTVQPRGAHVYRGQVTEEELRLAQRGGATTPQGHPVVDYEATYPNDCASNGAWCQEAKAGLPILNMVHRGEIVHGDINAIVIGSDREGKPSVDGRFLPETYPLESTNKRNPTLPNRLEPFREFVSVFHDENAASQAFPGLFDHSSPDQEDNPLVHTLHGVRDAFMINYGSGGVGAEAIANRLRVGPMHDCVDCAFEEFFLSSFTVGDPALLVDKPANFGLEGVKPLKIGGTTETDQAMYGFPADPSLLMLPKGSQGPKASLAYYPHDPANVHHSYIGDLVKFRNVHVGKEQHIFHLHNHQWLFNPNDDNSNYIDAQAIGPGSGYSYEIAFGGSGNRNRSAGDAVFHCHYYPHFAQGMWYLWRIHDTFEAGTRLQASGERAHITPWALASGLPAKGARALPDGEIVAGTPIPAVVPLPGKALAPMPGRVEVVPNPATSPFDPLRPVGSLAKVEKAPAFAGQPEIDWRPKLNPGYPFWIAGIEHTVGARPPTPPLDMDPAAGGWNGGLPRHAVAGYSAHGESEDTFHRLSAKKHEKKVKPVYFPETGTGVERVAMDFHATPEHLTSAVLRDGTVHTTVFRTNGAKPTPGAPFFDPCIDDRQRPLHKTQNPEPRFFNGVLDDRPMVDRQQPGDPSGAALFSMLGSSPFDAETPRIYKGANIQLDVTFNKLGYHYGQQRILALWEDVGLLLDKKSPPEPMVLRMNTFDCARYLHTNLVPKEYELDDYQISTPTDVIGQHIHLPKWDLPSADGSTNGWNYEDGTFSPGMVRSRIAAINAWNLAAPSHGLQPVPQPGGSLAPLAPTVHPYFQHATAGLDQLQLPADQCLQFWKDHGAEIFHNKDTNGLGRPRTCDWLGARTTLQRWFSDPVINAKSQHRGLGITFTHDHLGPSTHQQVGLYATMLTEPPNAVWRHNEEGYALYDTNKRSDGGPTSWQAVITGCKTHERDDPRRPCKTYGPLEVNRHLGETGEDSHREFFLQFGDFQHAYQKGEHFGIDETGVIKPPTADSFRVAINPSVRKPAQPNLPDIAAFEPTCPGAPAGVVVPRPCPEVISADDVGTMVVNYRNEPVAARVYDESRLAADGKKGTQAAFGKGDMAYAYQSRTDRKKSVLNGIGGEDPSVAGSQPHYPRDVNAQRQKGDPYTPILRAYSGDMVRIKIQAGSHEHEHNGTIHGLKWLQAGSGYGAAPNSGWRAAQNAGLSEQFTFSASIFDYEPANHRHTTDRLWAVDTSQDGLWSGVWGVIRTYSRRDKPEELASGMPPLVEPLLPLPQNPLPTLLSTRAHNPELPYTNDCDLGDGKQRVVRHYNVLAVLANRALANPLGALIPAGVPGLAPDGGTLTYNPRSTELSLRVHDDTGGVQPKTYRYGVGPLHDPTAVMLVREEDYDFNTRQLIPGVPVEPLVLRAAAGECVRVTLKNLLPRERLGSPMPDLNGYTSLSHVVTREPGAGASSMTGFNNNLIRPSHHIGLHPQLLHYDASVYDGSVVGLNIDNLVPPGGERVYQWYAGGLEVPNNDVALCRAPQVAAVNTLADLNRLRNRVVDGRVLRASTDLNTEWALGQRLLALIDQIPPDEVRQLETYQPGPPAEPDGPLPLKAEPLNRRTSLAVEAQTTLPPNLLTLRSLTRPGADLRLLREAVASRVTDTLVQGFLKGLFAQPAVQACLEGVAPDREATLAAAAAERQGLPQLGELANEFTADAAPLLPAGEVYNRFGTLVQGRVQLRAEERQRCTKAVLPVIREAFAANPELAGALGATRAQLVTRLWSDSFAFLVPEVDRDALGAGELRAVFDWWRPAYPPLDEKTTAVVSLDPKACRFEPIEFGGSNLSPPDRIKQGQKGAVGAMVVLPRGAAWAELNEDQVYDHQSPGKLLRKSRATATVLYPQSQPAGTLGLGGFRDFVAVHQKAQNLRYGKPLFARGSAALIGDPMGAAAVLAAERVADKENRDRISPEDAHDAGHMGINYGSEPMWFRFGMPADAAFGHGPKAGALSKREGLGGTKFAYQAFSTSVAAATACCSTDANQPSGTPTKPAGEPATPVFHTLMAGTQSRLRMLMPTGVGRGTTSHLHGHVWRRDPYLQGSSGVASQCIGANPLAMWLGGQDSITPMAHFDFVLDRSGGTHQVKGDFVLRDQAGFGVTNGLWAMVRHQQLKPPGLLDKVLQTPLRTSCQ